jgi:hypothetical protein
MKVIGVNTSIANSRRSNIFITCTSTGEFYHASLKTNGQDAADAADQQDYR